MSIVCWRVVHLPASPLEHLPKVVFLLMILRSSRFVLSQDSDDGGKYAQQLVRPEHAGCLVLYSHCVGVVEQLSAFSLGKGDEQEREK